MTSCRRTADRSAEKFHWEDWTSPSAGCWLTDGTNIYPVGVLSWDLIFPGNAGEFDILNLTGANSLPPDFPISTLVNLSDLTLTVDFGGIAIFFSAGNGEQPRMGVVRLIDRNRDKHDHDRCNHDQPPQLQHDPDDRMVDPHQRSADRVLFLAVKLPDQHRVCNAGNSLRAEPEFAGLHKQ